MTIKSDERLSHCALCEDPNFIYRDCALAAVTAIREACARKVRAFRDASYWSDVNHAALSMLANDIDSLALESQTASTTKTEGC